MRRRLLSLLLVAALACVQSGCGTLVNLCSPPTVPTTPGVVQCGFRFPETCFPLGGCARSTMLGGFGVVGGLGIGSDQPGPAELLLGAGMCTAGALVLIVDTPLSLVGDVVTWPIAQARMDGASWATWWGKQSRKESKPALEGQGPLLPGAESVEHLEPVWRPVATISEPAPASDQSFKIPEIDLPVLRLP
jgi:hypothetical protein